MAPAPSSPMRTGDVSPASRLDAIAFAYNGGNSRGRRRFEPEALVPRRDVDEHALVALHEARVGAFRLLQQLDVGEPLQDFFPDHPELQLGQPIADAAVDAEPERQVLTGPRPVDHIVVGPIDDLLVAVAGD